MSASAARLIVFDLGQVLIRVCDGWRDACRRIGIEVSDREPDGPAYSKMLEIVQRFDSGRIDLSQFAQEIAPLRGLTPDQIERIHENYLLGPFDGAAELVDELSAAGIETACLSNTNAGHWRLMSDPNNANYLPLDRLTYRFASHLIGACKPDAAAYEHVERETGRRGAQIVFFDDRDDNVAAARDRGWQASVIQINGDPVSQVRRHLAGLR